MLPVGALAVDFYDYLSLPDRPLHINSAPDWVSECSRLDLKYEINEEYKKWLDGRKVASFDGNSLGAELQVNPVKHFAFGLKKRFLAHQSWINNEKNEMDIFNFGSNNRVNGAYVKIGSDNLRVMFGKTKTYDRLSGHYDLHEDVVAALGSEPDVSFNTDGVCNYAKVFSKIKKIKLVLGYESNRYKHSIVGATDIMSLSINHERKVKCREAELSYDAGKRWYPYARFYTYEDFGNGINYKNNIGIFGNNNTTFKSWVRTFGSAYEYKHGWYYADYSRVFADVYADMFLNMVNIDPLFFFSTRYVSYDMNFKPKTGYMGRIGFKRHHRSMEYNMQYSLAKLHGNTCKTSKKSKMFGYDNETKIINRNLYLHRMDISVRRPDKYGFWDFGVKILAPQFKKEEKAGNLLSPAAPAEPSKRYRGGWQLTVMREFYLY